MFNEKLFWKNDPKINQRHHMCLPSPSMRALVVGESGCGKTTLLLNLLLQDKWLDYDKLILCGKSLHQPEYQLLTAALEKGYHKREICQLFEDGSGDIAQFINHLPRKIKNTNVNLEVYDGTLPVPDPRDLDRALKNLCVFDDMITDSNQSLAESYYTRGRHNNVSCIYISQSYHMLPRQTIRFNANCLLLFKLPNKDLRHIHGDIISGDMPYQEFNQFCRNVWQQDHSYIIINRTQLPGEGRYIAKFEHAYIPQKYITGQRLNNTMLKKLPMPEMHLSLPSNVSSE
jgi:ABC-type lipoprotein export system ATPase subunit